MTSLNEGLEIPDKIPDIYMEVISKEKEYIDLWAIKFNDSINRLMMSGKSEIEAKKEVLYCMEIIGFDDSLTRAIIEGIKKRRIEKISKMIVTAL